jgi:arylsulfatase A-like enzyme
MNRRDLCRAAVVTLAAASLVGWFGPAAVTAADEAARPAAGRPNVLFLLADDFRPDTIAALGHKIVKTPNLDRLVERGFVFRNVYVFGSNSGAVCLPSRTMIYTGCQLFNNNCRGSGRSPTFPQAMKAAGYATIRSGKPGNNPNDICQAFDEHLDGKTAEGNADNIIRFIGEHAGKEPLFLNMAGHEPHDPQFAPDNYYAMYKAEDIPLPPNFLPQHPFDNGEMTVRDEKTLPWPRTRESVTGKLARYYASITYLDAQYGRVLDALRRAGQLDNTIVVFAGDNGLSLGEHGLLGKQNLYEFGGMHVPLVFAGPDIPKGQSDALVYLMDVFPTVCELAGMPAVKGIDAKSLAPVITGKSPGVRDCLMTAYKNVQRSVRDDRWKLIRYPQVGVTQLFDLASDPHEMSNLADQPAYAAKVREMTALLEKAQKQYGDACPLSVADPEDPAWSPDKVPAETSKPKKAGAKKKKKRQG